MLSGKEVLTIQDKVFGLNLNLPSVKGHIWDLDDLAKGSEKEPTNPVL